MHWTNMFQIFCPHQLQPKAFQKIEIGRNRRSLKSNHHEDPVKTNGGVAKALKSKALLQKQLLPESPEFSAQR